MTVEPQAAQDEIKNADWIGEVEIVSIKSFADSKLDWRWIAQARVREVEYSLEESWVDGDILEIEGYGGEGDDFGVIYSGNPRPRTGQSYRVHLNKEQNRFRISGFHLGLQPLNGQRGFTRNRTDGSNGDGSGPFLHWRTNYFPIPFYISAETFVGHPSFPKAIQTSFDTWTNLESTVLDFQGMGCTVAKSHSNDGENNIVYVTSNWPFDSSVIAITRNFYVSGSNPNSGQILDSDILLNAVDNDFTTTGEAGKHDVQNILTHEIGHLIGLGHESGTIDADATMFSVAVAGELKKRTLKSSDIEGALSGYAGMSNKMIGSHLDCAIREGSGGCASVPLCNVSTGAKLWQLVIWLFLLLLPKLHRTVSKRRLF